MPSDEKPAGRDENLCTNQKTPQGTSGDARQPPPEGPQRALGKDDRSTWKASPARNAHPTRQSLPARMGKPLASASPKRQRTGQCCEQSASLRAVRPFRLALALSAWGRSERSSLHSCHSTSCALRPMHLPHERFRAARERSSGKLDLTRSTRARTQTERSAFSTLRPSGPECRAPLQPEQTRRPVLRQHPPGQRGRDRQRRPKQIPQLPTEAGPSPSRSQALKGSRGESAQTRRLTSGPNGSRRRWSNRPRPQPRTSASWRQSRHAPAARHRKPESLPAALPPARAKQDPWMRKRRSCVLSPGEAPPKDSQSAPAMRSERTSGTSPQKRRASEARSPP